MHKIKAGPSTTALNSARMRALQIVLLKTCMYEKYN